MGQGRRFAIVVAPIAADAMRREPISRRLPSMASIPARTPSRAAPASASCPAAETMASSPGVTSVMGQSPSGRSRQRVPSGGLRGAGPIRAEPRDLPVQLGGRRTAERRVARPLRGGTEAGGGRVGHGAHSRFLLGSQP
jgi:hypothetical protein